MNTEFDFRWTPLEATQAEVLTFLMVDGFKKHHYFILRKHDENEWVAFRQNGDRMIQPPETFGRYANIENAKKMLVQEWIERHEPEPVITWEWSSRPDMTIANLHCNGILTKYDVVRHHNGILWIARFNIEEIHNASEPDKAMEMAENACRKEFRS